MANTKFQTLYLSKEDLLKVVNALTERGNGYRRGLLAWRTYPLG